MVDLVVLDEKLKKSKGTEEEPFEGEITVEEFAAAIKQQWEDEKKGGKIQKYVLDNLQLAKNGAGVQQLLEALNHPSYVINVQLEEK